MIKVAQSQTDAIVQGKINIGFGEFTGLKQWDAFKIYLQQFFMFSMHVRGMLRIK